MSISESSHRKGSPALEWIVGNISAIVVLAILGFLSYEALFGDTGPPNLVATIDGIQTVEGGTLALVTLSNRGDRAAAEIAVEATWQDGGPEGARKEIRFDYVASHAVRRGAFVMDRPAATANDVRVRINGYVEP